MKKPSYGLQKFTAGGLALTAGLFFTSVGCSVTQMSSGEKHTGPVTVRSEYGRGFEFKRPNGEIFEMAFSPDYLGPQIAIGDQLSDLTYTDEKNHLAFFVKATLVSESPKADKILYQSIYTGWTSCNGDGVCQSQNGGRPMYLWKDGGYHDKPQPTKEK